jgi:hypothetical protein
MKKSKIIQAIEEVLAEKKRPGNYLRKSTAKVLKLPLPVDKQD